MFGQLFLYLETKEKLMKKLLFIFLGLASFNVYANSCGGEYQPATGTCRIIDSSGRQILYNVGTPPIIQRSKQPQSRQHQCPVQIRGMGG